MTAPVTSQERPPGSLSPAPEAPLHPRSDVQLHGDERLGPGFQRVLLGQYDRMIQALGSVGKSPDKGVHTARKAMKRTRGLLRLARDEVGRDPYRAENTVLRDSARRLSGVREGHVRLRTLDRVRSEYGSVLVDDAFETTRVFLQERSARERGAVLEDRQSMADIVVTLKTARARIGAWDPGGPPHHASVLAAPGLRNDFASFAGGLHRIYRRGHRGMSRAYDERSTEAFHEWRKRVKYLRYNMESMRPVWPAFFEAQASALDELGELLGDDHDLAGLEQVAIDHPGAFADERERTMLLMLAGRLRAELQHATVPIARTVYAEEPDQFVSRIGSYWAAARR